MNNQEIYCTKCKPGFFGVINTSNIIYESAHIFD